MNWREPKRSMNKGNGLRFCLDGRMESMLFFLYFSITDGHHMEFAVSVLYGISISI